MPERDANQLAADAERSLRQVLVQYVNAMVALGWTMVNVQPEKSLDELVGLVGTLQQERDYLRDRGDKNARRAQAAEAALAEARQALTEIRAALQNGEPNDALALTRRALAATGGDTAEPCTFHIGCRATVHTDGCPLA